MKLDHLLDNTTSLRMPKKVLKRPKGLILTHRRCTAQWGENFSMVTLGPSKLSESRGVSSVLFPF